MGRDYQVDLKKPLDISLALRGDERNPVAWYLDPPKIEPVQDGDWTAKVSSGASVNFNNIWFNPHAHGTHTECVGHITPAFHSLNDHLRTYFFFAKLVSIQPHRQGQDELITEDQVRKVLQDNEAEALILRSLPNTIAKRSKQYSHTNWPYLSEAAARYIRTCGIMHLLVDLPSVDREEDGGKLLAHRAFWNYPKEPRLEATITELIYVPQKILDGYYFLNLQPASFENDAAPSKPVLYKMK